MRQTASQVLLVAAIATLVLFTNLGGARLWDRDEPRNAGCAAEMLSRGDWVTPVFNAELRTHKPVLLYWFIMSAYALFGVNEFAARFWSAALAVGTCCCTYLMGRRLFGATVGVWAGVILATTLMFDVAGRAATPDSLLIFFTTLAMTVYVVCVFPSADSSEPGMPGALGSFPSFVPAALLYGALGAAVLAKGPVGFVLPTAVLGLFELIRHLPPTTNSRSDDRWRRWRSWLGILSPVHFLRTCWAMRPITAAATMLLVALPWYVWVGLRTDGEFLRGFFLEHNVSRAMQAMEGHQGSPLFYPVAILAGFFPWSIFAIPVGLAAIRHARDDERARWAYVFAACWVGVWVGIFSLAQTKLPNYVIPCYPAIALLTGSFVARGLGEAAGIGQGWLRASFGSAVLVGLALLIALPFVAQRYLPGDEWLALIGLVPLGGGVAAWVFAERQLRQRAAFLYAASAVVWATILFGVVTAQVDRHQQNHRLLQTFAVHSDSTQARVASVGLLEPSWIFYGGRPIDELTEPEIGVPGPTWVERGGRWVRKPAVSIDDLIRDGSPVWILTSDRHLETLRAKLPRDFQLLAECPRFLRKGNLVVLGRPPSPLVAEKQNRGGTPH